MNEVSDDVLAIEIKHLKKHDDSQDKRIQALEDYNRSLLMKGIIGLGAVVAALIGIIWSMR